MFLKVKLLSLFVLKTPESHLKIYSVNSIFWRFPEHIEKHLQHTWPDDPEWKISSARVVQMLTFFFSCSQTFNSVTRSSVTNNTFIPRRFIIIHPGGNFSVSTFSTPPSHWLADDTGDNYWTLTRADYTPMGRHSKTWSVCTVRGINADYFALNAKLVQMSRWQWTSRWGCGSLSLRPRLPQQRDTSHLGSNVTAESHVESFITYLYGQSVVSYFFTPEKAAMYIRRGQTAPETCYSPLCHDIFHDERKTCCLMHVHANRVLCRAF